MDHTPTSGQTSVPPTPTTGTGVNTLRTSMGEFEFDQTIKVKTPASGSMFFNRYRLDRVLGRGGMGVVWLADDLKLERPVALKFLPSLLGLDAAAVKELKVETRRGLELSHPNIVRIYDFVDDEEVAAISMEFVDGKTLSELRLGTPSGVFTVDQVRQWLPGVCAALDYAHFQRKLVHRDLKPANIMVTTKDNVAKVADFGIARSLSDTMSRLSAANLGTSGTLPYMSPQQAMGERPMPTDDVYSLGATIYELLSGKPPFYRGDISTQICSKVPSSMFERRAELEISATDKIPKDWENAIAMCLNKDASLRPQSAGALAEMLGLQSSITSGVTKTFVSKESASTPVAAPKSKAPLLAAAAVVALGAGAAVHHFKTQKPAEAPVVVAKVEDKPTTATPAKTEAEPKKDAPKADTAKAEPKKESSPAPAAEPPKSEAPAPVVAAATPAVQTPAATTAEPAAPPAATAAQVTPGTMPATPQASPPVTIVTMNGQPGTPAQAGTAVAVNGQPPAMSTALPGSTPPMVPAVAMPAVPGTTMPVAAQPASPLAQPAATPPPNGYWPIAVLFPTPPHAAYSESGRRRLLYEAQGFLRDKDLYNSNQDGKEGKGTHNAIVLFQAKSGLVPNGMLDGATLMAMGLFGQSDDNAWIPPAVPTTGYDGNYSGTGGRRRGPMPEPEQSIFQKAGQSIGRMFKRN